MDTKKNIPWGSKSVQCSIIAMLQSKLHDVGSEEMANDVIISKLFPT